MTYCIGVMLDKGMIFASDSRTNAGVDNFAKFCKMTVFERRDNRVVVLLSSGNLYAAHHPPGNDFPISTLFLDVLGQLVPTTAGKWITHPPTRCTSGHRPGPGEMLVGIKPVSGTAAGTRRVRAAHAVRRCTGCRLIAIARRWRGRRWCVSRPFTSEGGESPISSGPAAPPEMLRTVGWVETLASTGVHLAQEQI